MTPQDAATIRDVFAKIRAMGTAVDDVEAARLVEQELRTNPAAALNLIKVVVGLEQERDQFATHIDELNGYIDQLEAQLADPARGAAQSQQSGGLFGGTIQGSPWERGRGTATPAPAWTGGSTDHGGVDSRLQAQPTPWGRSETPAPGPWGQPAAQPQGGGFWGSALRTGAGVAGGLVAFEAMKGLFGGHDRPEGREGERHGLFGAEREASREPSSGEPRETSGGFGGEAPGREHEGVVADNIDFFGGSDGEDSA